jgi:hypothetical protein
MPSAAINISDPALAEAMFQLADALRSREQGKESSPTYLEMARLANEVSAQLHELARCLVAAARSDENATWTDVGAAFGVTRQAALRRWSMPS